MAFSLVFLLFAFSEAPAPAASPLTRIADALALGRAADEAGLPVSLRGVVTWVGPGAFTLDDGKSGIYIEPDAARARGVWHGDDRSVGRVHEGVVLEVDGVCVPAGYSPAVLPFRLTIHGSAPLPAPRPFDRSEFFSGADCGQRIVVKGVVLGYQRDAEGWMLRMQSDNDVYWGSVAQRILADPRPLLDREVTLRGVGGALFNARGELMAPRIRVSRSEDLIVDSGLSHAPAAVPLVPLNQFAGYRPFAQGSHRVRIRGTVSFAIPGKYLYLSDGRRNVRVVPQADWAAQPGDLIEAVGYVDRSHAVGLLGGAELRALGREIPPSPVAITPEQILTTVGAAAGSGQAPNPSDYDGTLIRFRATLLSVETPAPPALPAPRLMLRQGHLAVEASLPTSDGRMVDSLAAGSVLELTGVAIVEYGLSDESVPYVHPLRVGLVVGSPEGVRLVQTPPWWTTGRLFAAVLLIMLVLGAALIWVGQLRLAVKRQTARLAEEMRARRDAAVDFQATLRERTRLAANLHDTLLQSLSGLKYQLVACETESIPVQHRPANHLAIARKMVERGQADLRGTVWALRALPAGEADLKEALSAAADRAAGGRAVAVAIEGEGAMAALSDFVAGNLLLIAQEAVTNGVRHGEAARVRIAFERTPAGDRVVLTVQDDGRGFDPAAAPGAKAGHFGLLGMRERAERLGGALQISSQPGAGATVRVEVLVRTFDAELS